MTKNYWIATGSVRGSCGHRHKTERSARKCAVKDAKGISRRYPSTFPTRAYSDRYPKCMGDKEFCERTEDDEELYYTEVN